MTPAGGGAASATTYSYDANGSLTTRSDGLSLSQDAANLTSSITPPGGSQIPMSYSGLNQTERVQAGTASFVYDLLGLSRRSDASGVVYELRCGCGQLLSERGASGTNYVLFDALGSTIGLADGTGALVASWTYDAWGNVLAKTGSATTPVLFQGAYLDVATGLYKMGARYYDATVGRFTERDRAWGKADDPQTLNAYTFAGNSPTNVTDPTGYCYWACFWVCAVVVIIACTVITFVQCEIACLGFLPCSFLCEALSVVYCYAATITYCQLTCKRIC